MLWMEGWTCSEVVAAGAVIISAAGDYWNATYHYVLYRCSSNYVALHDTHYEWMYVMLSSIAIQSMLILSVMQ